jgi:hypothetical protein
MEVYQGTLTIKCQEIVLFNVTLDFCCWVTSFSTGWLTFLFRYMKFRTYPILATVQAFRCLSTFAKSDY